MASALVAVDDRTLTAEKDGSNRAFIPIIHMADYNSSEGIDPHEWTHTRNTWTTGLGASASSPPIEEFSSALLARDSVRQEQRWKVPTAGTLGGGTVATADDLVFQGQLDGSINAYDTSDGRKVWSFNAEVAML